MKQIPTFQNISADFIQHINLNSQLVIIRIVYNVRNSFFTLRFIDQEDNEVTGIKMVQNWPLLRSHKALLNFSGNLIILKDDISLGDTITYDSLGNGYNLYYMTEQEALQWEDNNGIQ